MTDVTSSIVHKKIYESGNLYFTDTNIITLLIIGASIMLALHLRKNITLIPGRLQGFFEVFVEFMDDLAQGMMGKEWGRYFMPMAITMFMLVFICNVLSLIPGSIFKSPTTSLNSTVAWAGIVFVVSHLYGIKIKGFFPYIKSFFEPMFFLAPLNFVGELAKPISHSFRLFGNMAGGGIITAIFIFLMSKFLIGGIPVLTILIPVPFNAFFGVFQGTIQAFIFAMLTLAYIANSIG